MTNPHQHTNETEGLEPQQYQKMYGETDVPLKDIRQSLMQKLLVFGAILFVLVGLMSAVLTFPDQVELPFVLQSDMDEHIYTYPFPVYVQQRMVSAGDAVSLDDPLIHITAPEIVELLTNSREARFNLDHFREFETQSIKKERNILQSNLEQYAIRIRQLRSQLANANDTWQSNKARLESELQEATEKLEAFQKLFDSGNIHRFELAEQENQQRRIADELSTARLRFERESETLRSSITDLQLESGIGRNRIAQLDNRLHADSIALNTAWQMASDRIAHLFGNHDIREGGIVLKAPENGTVTYLFEGDREVRQGTTLLRLAHSESPLYAFVKCPPVIRGKLQNGMDSHLKVHSFPFFEWGVLDARIRHMSNSPDENGDYNVLIEITNSGNLEGLLQKGLSGDALIVIQERTLLQYIFLGLKKTYHSVMDG